MLHNALPSGVLSCWGVFSPPLCEVARASLARGTELCGAAFWRKNLFSSILFSHRKLQRNHIATKSHPHCNHVAITSLAVAQSHRNQVASTLQPRCNHIAGCSAWPRPPSVDPIPAVSSGFAAVSEVSAETSAQLRSHVQARVRI